MLTFTIRRLFLSIPTLLFISLVIFLLLQLGLHGRQFVAQSTGSGILLRGRIAHF